MDDRELEDGDFDYVEVRLNYVHSVGLQESCLDTIIQVPWSAGVGKTRCSSRGDKSAA